MTIEKIQNGNDLTMALEGRLDTTTAPQLEAEITALTGEENLVMDFDKLEYISSAGLRVILAAQKKLGAGNMVIRNVCDDIKEVFDITGFSDILTVE
ncbi:MAG: STAS domain-containing protein [Oscillospiraceae bacterium]|nr:STAS domain-containing protein [Candidatus Equicaccousia limihippi]